MVSSVRFIFLQVFQHFNKAGIVLRHHDAEPYKFSIQALEGGTVTDYQALADAGFKNIIRGKAWFQDLKKNEVCIGGDASAGQFNFSGLGTTGGGVAGNSFPDVRTGIRAQVQHLKAYASSEDLNQACVDNRFQYVARESAPYVEWLGIQENPYGGGWAAGRSYGYKLRSLLAGLKGEEYAWPESTETVER